MFIGYSLLSFCLLSDARRHPLWHFSSVARLKSALYNNKLFHEDCSDPFITHLLQNCPNTQQQKQLTDKLIQEGLLAENGDSSSLQAIFRSIDNDQISSVLIQDFNFPPWMAHHTRAAIVPVLAERIAATPVRSDESKGPSQQTSTSSSPATDVFALDIKTNTTRRPHMKKTVVNPTAKARPSDNYGQQEAPIRKATADVYLRHARLFLGWHMEQRGQFGKNSSLFDIIPNKEKESASDVVAFLLWLRKTRSISASYEANLVRGLIKLFKYRFAHESDATATNQPYDDIPALRELRKLQRDANRKQSVAGRSSDEAQKWLTWPQFLDVVQRAGEELRNEMKSLDESNAKERRKIAVLYQKYLILQIFASVPDRQRTIRELELGRTFVKDDECWTIRHGADDYKTGKVYGQRTGSIDPFD